MLPENVLELINQFSFDSRLCDKIKEWGQARSFVSFVKKYDNKILKKLNTAKEIEDKRDIGIELYIAFIFSKVNCKVTYEPDLSISSKPDFKITYKNTSFFCEVKRLREFITGEIDNEEMYKKCGDIICAKIVQTVPNEMNIIYVRRMLNPNFIDLNNAVNNLSKMKTTDPKQFLRKIKQNKINSIDDFDRYWKQLSGFVFNDRIWENTDTEKPLTPIIKSIIEEAIKIPF